MSALQPVLVEVEIAAPAGLVITATVRALVRDPSGALYYQADLIHRGGGLYSAEEPLQLSLEAAPGLWRLVVLAASSLPVSGQNLKVFEPAPVPLHDFGGERALTGGISLMVPEALREIVSLGGTWAGGRVWWYEGGQLELWWAPGPAKPLRYDTALVMLETTYDQANSPRVLDVADAEWQGQTAFLFREEWPGDEIGAGETLVIQGPDLWLYVLRVRSKGGSVPRLLYQVRDTFAFTQ